jgi:phage/plasmid-like protein (TIGR03299 family)
MSHEISTTNGVASFADSQIDSKGRVDAWHKLGTPVGHAMTAEEALEAAHLANWNVRKRPVWVDIREDDPQNQPHGLVLPNEYATVFTNPVSGLITPIKGGLGTKYTPIQNEALTEFSDALVAESGAHYETAAALRNYSQIFLTMKLPQKFILRGKEGEDISEYYLALFNSHDGNSAMFGVISQVRVVCANTANMAIKGATSKFSIPHTSGWKNRAEIAREKLGLTLAYRESFEAEITTLFNEAMSVDEMKLFAYDLSEVHKAEKESVAATKRTNEANAIIKLFVESPTIKGTPIEGTRWGAFNAVTEYVDHFQGVRGAGEDTDKIALARATRSVALATTGNTGLKADAWALLRS